MPALSPAAGSDLPQASAGPSQRVLLVDEGLPGLELQSLQHDLGGTWGAPHPARGTGQGEQTLPHAPASPSPWQSPRSGTVRPGGLNRSLQASARWPLSRATVASKGEPGCAPTAPAPCEPRAGTVGFVSANGSGVWAAQSRLRAGKPLRPQQEAGSGQG